MSHAGPVGTIGSAGASGMTSVTGTIPLPRYKLGDVVQVGASPIQGSVFAFDFVQESMCWHYYLEDGKHFDEDKLILVKPAKEEKGYTFQTMQESMNTITVLPNVPSKAQIHTLVCTHPGCEHTYPLLEADRAEQALKFSTYTVMCGCGHTSVYDSHTLQPLKGQDPSKGLKFDNGKRRASLLPTGVLNIVIDVLELGAKKYALNNWQKVENGRTRYYDAALRHIDAWWNGQSHDQESGLHHLAHAICCMMFLMWLDKEKETK